MALVVSLIILFLTSIIGMQSMQTASMQEKMAANSLDRLKALQSAESGVRAGIKRLNSAAYSLDTFVNNVNATGAYDIRREGAFNQAGSNKTIIDWFANRSATGWPWDDASKRSETNYHIDASNSMALASKPQFAIGMQEAILRAGSEGYQCLPFSIIGAGQGSSANTRALIEVKVIPKSGCHRSLVK
ncbi:MAG: hypothetical protein KAG19_04845 [Methylococcales bacterium]|nr:hypothetical protein [Methylococcales bacterium]